MSDWDERIKKEDRNLIFFWTGLKNLWSLFGDERKTMWWAVIFLIGVKVLDLLVPYLLKIVFDEIPQIAGGGGISDYLWMVIGAMFVLKLIMIVFRHYGMDWFFLKSAIKMENMWPMQAQEKLLSLSLGYHENENTGKKISKINRGCERMINATVNLFWGLVPQFFYLILNIIFILIIDWKLGVLFILPFYPAMKLHFMIFDRHAEDWHHWEKEKEKADGLLCQSVINIRTVQNYTREKQEKENHSKIRFGMRDLDIDIHERMRLPFFGFSFLLHFFFVLTLALGIYFVHMGWSTIGSVVFILATGNVTIQSINDLMFGYTNVMRQFISVNRMKELLEEQPDIVNSDNAIIPSEISGKYSFSNVTFAYPGKEKPVLRDFSMKINPGEMVALVGKSGEGKTTAVKLLCRMHDINSGAIKLDGHDIQALDLNWYRQQFAIVQQDVDIFDATLRENVSYPYPEATDEQVIEAVRAAHLNVVLDDENRFAEGLETEVGERGIRLSGGERQRVGIARAYLALLTGAKVLVLDEATSNLDSEAEKAIQKMLSQLREKMKISIVAIAHRLSTIRRADKICVIDNGHISEQGSHEELVDLGGRYAHSAGLQSLA